MAENALIVTGMHRSGTSLVARYLHAAGVDLGERLLEAGPYNRYGYFEDVEIMSFQRDILLREFGHPIWAGGPPKTWPEDVARARALVAARCSKPLWGWKDPRTSLFLEMWAGVLPQAHFLVVVRHPAQVVDSLRRRSHRSRLYWPPTVNLYLRQWLIYNRACLDFARRPGAAVLFITIAGVTGRPEILAERLVEWYGHGFSTAAFDTVYHGEALKHEATWPRWASARLMKEALALYEELLALAAV